MSRKQGPRAVGMRPSANAAHRRPAAARKSDIRQGGGGMSRKRGPRTAGMRPSAIAACRRPVAAGKMMTCKEAAP